MQKKVLIPLTAAVLFSIIILLNHNQPFFKPVTGIVQSVFSVPKSIVYGLKLGSNDSEELVKLKKENEELVKKISEYDRIRRDNIALRSQFETSENIKFNSLPAQVLGFAGDASTPEALIVDKGSKDGVYKDAAVIVANNLIGKISHVDQVFSKVTLISSQDFAALAKTSDTSTQGVAKGNGDFILLDRVAVTDTLNRDAILVTNGDINEQGVGIPPDLVLGKLTSVNKSANLPFQTAKIESSVNFSKLEIVFIVLGLR